MSFKPCDIALGLWIAAMAGSAGGLRAAERGPESPRPLRRSFDFAPPRRGEMLANPGSGTGSPPHLAEFAPVTPADARPAATAGTGDGATARSGAERLQPGPPPAEPAPTPDSAEDLSPPDRNLAGRISQLGIAGFLASSQDGSAAAAEASTFDRARRELAASLSRWDALYPRPARVADEPVDAVVSPGRVIFRQAPDRMVGGAGMPF